MTEIGPTGPIKGSGRVEGKKSSRPIDIVQNVAAKSDDVQISQAARFIVEAKDLPPIREDKVRDVKRQIENGKFDNDERLNGAVDKLAQDNLDTIA